MIHSHLPIRSPIRRGRVVGWLLLAVMATATGCAVPDTALPQPDVAPTQQEPDSPVSPLATGAYLSLTQTKWRLVEATYRGEPLQFYAIDPVYVSFEVVGETAAVTLTSPLCPGGGYELSFEKQQRYRLMRPEMVAIDCDEPKDTQKNNAFDALGATISFAVNGGQLTLTGEEARMVLRAEDDN